MNAERAELGDFQTPAELADEVCRLLAGRGLAPRSLVEPTCGTGSLLLAALDRFPSASAGLGVDVEQAYVDALGRALGARRDGAKVTLVRASFFDADWTSLVAALPDPVLAIGNPPWVTNARLGATGGTNLPEKSNFQGHAGLDAITGKSNFDISESMLVRLLELFDGRDATVAMLCKTAVARRALARAWRAGLGLADAEIRALDAARYFGVSVDACLLVCSLSPSGARARECRVYDSLEARAPASTIGYCEGRLLADVDAYRRWRHLAARDDARDTWRSGVKHDCARVMELRRERGRYVNGFGESVALEDDYVYPMLKGSDVANGRVAAPSRWMLVTQRAVGEDTDAIRLRAPKTWAYLRAHAALLDGRRSRVYRKRAPFSVFGVGDYTFAPWKVAVSGFYKRLRFVRVGEYAGRPVVFDDTVYFVACSSEREAALVADVLDSAPAREFYSAFLFWDAKRPVTAEVLRRLDVRALARDRRPR